MVEPLKRFMRLASKKNFSIPDALVMIYAYEALSDGQWIWGMAVVLVGGLATSVLAHYYERGSFEPEEDRP